MSNRRTVCFTEKERFIVYCKDSSLSNSMYDRVVVLLLVSIFLVLEVATE